MPAIANIVMNQSVMSIQFIQCFNCITIIADIFEQKPHHVMLHKREREREHDNILNS